MTKLTDEPGEGDGTRPRKEKDTHYSRKGSHEKRSAETTRQREEEKLRRREARKKDKDSRGR